jgi:hypothetical protein
LSPGRGATQLPRKLAPGAAVVTGDRPPPWGACKGFACDLGLRTDLLIGLGTSGKSDNLMAAVQAAHEKDIIVNALTVETAGACATCSFSN